MTFFQPVSRALVRRSHRIVSVSSTSIGISRTSSLPTTDISHKQPTNDIFRHRHHHVAVTRPSTRALHSSSPRRRDDDSFGSSGRRPTDLQTPRSGPINPGANDVYAEGTPGEPKTGESLPSGIAPSTLYTFEDVRSISASPESYPHHLLVDVREPAELLQTGRIPGAVNVPITSAPDSFFLSAEDFEDKYGFARPDEKDEVIFYCKAGVRSKAAARLAGQAGFGGKVGEYPGSWLEWEKNGGAVQRE